MGRSQAKYRATHGRGRGRGRGDATGGRGSASTRRQPSHLRNLGSNAFRFEEREAADDEQATGSEQVENYGGRTQFFASESNYREQMGAAPGAYFQSRVMKQWEEKDEAADDNGAMGVLDLDWIAAQLELVAPEIRYRMDPKYCIDLPFESQEEEASESDEEKEKSVVVAEKTVEPIAVTSKSTPGDEDLDFLLNLSASTSGGNKAAPKPTVPMAAASAPTRTPAETEQLEDWLDDVLDM